VILLHPLNVQPDAMRSICRSLTANGIDCLWLTMPYYGERSSNGFAAALAMAVSTDRLIEATRQAVMDVRRATAFLASRSDIDSAQISLMGCSLGSLVAALTMGVDGRYPQAVLILSGGDITQMLADNPIVMPMLSLTIRADLATETARTPGAPASREVDIKELLRQRLTIIEPLTWCDRAADTRVLMINARQDALIPPALTAKLTQALPHAESRWYNGDHWGLPVDRATADVIAFLKR
jgi:dienelactone hydrolase